MKKLLGCLIVLALATSVHSEEVLGLHNALNVFSAYQTDTSGGGAPAKSANAAPADLSVTAGYTLEVTGDGPSTAKPELFIEGEQPIVLGTKAYGRAFLRLGLTITPGQPQDQPTTILNYSGVEFGAGYAYVLGKADDGSKTALIAEGGFRTLQGTPDPAKRAPKYYLVGARFSTGASAGVVGLGQDAQVGEYGGVQVMTYGHIALPQTQGIGNVGWDVSLPMGTPAALPNQEGVAVPLTQHPVVKLTVYVDLANLWGVLGIKK